MFSYLSLTNFKSFASAYIDLEPLTMLTGLNSSGKSSILQSIRLWHSGEMLDGHGSLNTFASVHSENQSFSILVGVRFCDLVNESQIDFIPNSGLQYDKKSDIISKIDLSYLSAARLGPQVNSALRKSNSQNSAGHFGEHIVDYLLENRDLAGVPKTLRLDNDQEISSVYENITSWLSLISPGVSFDPYAVREADIGWLEFYKRRPTNVGFGLSYTIPLISTILIECAKLHSVRTETQSVVVPVLLIENPEAHLHPRGQTQIGRLIALAAAQGVQCIIETHSDHLINGVRIAVKNGEIEQNDVVCHYLKYSHSDEKSSVDTIYVDQYGMFDHWPSGFCDETEINLLQLT